MNEHSFENRAALTSAGCIIVFPFLHFYSVNYGNELFSGQVFMSFSLASIGILSLLLGAALLVGARLLRIPAYRIAALFSGFVVLFFLFKPIHAAALDVLKGSRAPMGAMLVYLTVYLLALSVIWHLAKWRVFHTATVVFVAAMMVGSSARLIGASAGARAETDSSGSGVTAQRSIISRDALNPGELPNIYYVITDGYASLDVLKEQMGFEDTTIHKLSTNYGYTHIPTAVSSYTATYLTLTSIFQGDYPVGETSPPYTDRNSFYPRILLKDAPPATVAAAKRLGYEFYIVGNQWADCQGHHVKCLKGQGPLLVVPYEVRLFIEPTPVGLLHNLYGHLLERDRRQGKNTPSGVDAIGKVLAQFESGNRPDGPYFMFVHHLQPHPPYIYEADCSPRQVFDFNLEGWGRAAQPQYLNNLSCTNRRLLELAAYLKDHDPQAIIVFQADHGSAFTVDWSVPIDRWEDKAVRERTSILSFIHAPENCRRWLRPDLNSVNTLRFVLGCAVGQEPRFVENDAYIASYPKKKAADYVKVRRVRRFDDQSAASLD